MSVHPTPDSLRAATATSTDRRTRATSAPSGAPATDDTGIRRVDDAAFADRVRRASELINRALEDSRRDLRFSVDERTGKTVVKVMRPGTGEVLRQVPSAEALRLAERLRAGEPLRSLGIDEWS